MNRGHPPGLLLITDRRRVRIPLAEACARALDAGFRALMLREKDLGADALLKLALPLHALCQDRNRVFLINDRVDVALALPRAGVHLGARGLPLRAARRLLGPDRLLGYSAHEVDEAQRALEEGADYVTLSPIFPSRSKPELEARGLPFLETALERLPRDRVLPLGGLEAANLPLLRRRGLTGAAVMGAVMRNEDPGAAARILVSAWEREEVSA